MQLLVSVTSAAEATAALAGGAHFIDAKDPAAGALGAVPLDRFDCIVRAIAGVRPVSAALGDAENQAAVERIAGEFAAAGAAFVKVGFAGIDRADRVFHLVAAAVRGATVSSATTSIVAVAYADADRAHSISPSRLVDIAAKSGAAGVLLDTFDKRSGGLLDLMPPRTLDAWVAAAHGAGLFVALAGKLMASDLPLVRDAGADIAGVRGAACEGGRTGRVTTDRIRLLRSACEVGLLSVVLTE
jgi:(5-formylfuran-3-yl)methyl phosphate synthase